VGGPHAGYARDLFANRRLLLLGVSGGADHQCLAVARANRRDTRGDVVKTEIDHHIALFDYRGKVVSLVDLADDLQLWKARSTRNEHLPHATARSGNDHLRHKNGMDSKPT